MQHDGPDSDHSRGGAAGDVGAPGVRRREFLTRLAAGGVVLSGAGLLDACGGSGGGGSKGAGTGTAKSGVLDGGGADGPVRRGGSLTIGMTGGSSADTLNPIKANSMTDIARQCQLYDSLAYLDSNAQPQLMLAEEMTPNKDATEWTIRVREGITFHNGKPLGADDVIYSIQQLGLPKNASSAESQLTSVDLNGIRKLDARTCRVSMHQPYASFMDSWSARNFFNVFPVGFDPQKPVGTGPFRFQSFTPGNQSVFVRNPDYWQHGFPYLDKLTIVDFEDETSQVNALSSGQVDAINSLTNASITNVKSSGGYVAVANGGLWTPIFFRVDVKPFNDLRVLTALKLVVDREQMRQLVFGDYGLIGNDMFGIFDGAYDKAIPQRVQDIDKAKSLLKQAGQENLTIQLTVANVAQGITQAVQVYAQQAAAAGVKVSIRTVTETELYGPNYLKWPASVDYWVYNPYFLQVGASSVPGASFNETHFVDPAYARLYRQAEAEPDRAKRDEIGHEMDRIYYEKGGYVIPYFSPTIDGYAKRVHGAQTSKVGGSFNNFDLKQLWVE